MLPAIRPCPTIVIPATVVTVLTDPSGPTRPFPFAAMIRPCAILTSPFPAVGQPPPDETLHVPVELR